MKGDYGCIRFWYFPNFIHYQKLYECARFWCFPNFIHYQRLEILNRSTIHETNCIYLVYGDDDLVCLCLRWGDSRLKDKWICLLDFLLLNNFWGSMETPKMLLFWKKNIESFLKYCPTLTSPAPNLYLSKKNKIVFEKCQVQLFSTL